MIPRGWVVFLSLRIGLSQSKTIKPVANSELILQLHSPSRDVEEGVVQAVHGLHHSNRPGVSVVQDTSSQLHSRRNQTNFLSCPASYKTDPSWCLKWYKHLRISNQSKAKASKANVLINSIKHVLHSLSQYIYLHWREWKLWHGPCQSCHQCWGGLAELVMDIIIIEVLNILSCNCCWARILNSFHSFCFFLAPSNRFMLFMKKNKLSSAEDGLWKHFCWS